MHDFLYLPTHKRADFQRLSISAVLITGCLLLLSSCNGMSGTATTTANNVKSARVVLAAKVDASLRTQGLAQLETLQQWAALMQQYNGNASTYQQELISDQQALRVAQTESAYQAVLQTLDQQVQSIKMPALKNEATNQEHLLMQQADAWSQQHTYHDDYNNTTYHLGYEYGTNGVDGFVQDELSRAHTLADYQRAIEDADMFLTSFQAYKTNVSDKTPWNQAHVTDLQLMQYYKTFNQKVVVVSLGEQVMRVYDNGKLVKAIKVTTGRPEKPSLPGAWQVEQKLSPTVFKSDEPVGSAYWYPNTPINYAMLYHSGGYFIHDSWWRADYGFGTQFPHADSSGDSFSFDGSHGCINVSKTEAAWLYNYVNVSTRVIVY